VHLVGFTIGICYDAWPYEHQTVFSIKYITRHHTDRYIVCTDARITYSHIPEYDEACTLISSNCTSTVIDP